MKMKNLMMPLALIFCALLCGTVMAKDVVSKKSAIPSYYQFEDVKPNVNGANSDVPCNIIIAPTFRDSDWIISFSQNGHEVYSFTTPYYSVGDVVDGYENLGSVAEGTYDITFTSLDSYYPFHYLALPDGTDKDYVNCYQNGYTFHDITITSATGCELLATPDLE